MKPKSISLLILFAVTSCGSLIHDAAADITVDALVSLKTDIQVPSRVAGVIGELRVKEGDVVQRGDIIAQFDPAMAHEERNAAEREAEIYEIQKDNDIEFRLSKKSRDVSLRELQRSLRANERYDKSVSSTELERLRMLVDQAELSAEKAKLDQEVAGASYKSKQALVRTADQKLQYHRVVSPIQGMVVMRFAKAGEWLDVGQPIVRLIQLDPLRIEAYLDGNTFGDEAVGRPVTFLVSRGEAEVSFQGRVVFVSPELDPVDGMVRVWAEVENPKRVLRPGMRGKLSIPSESKPVALSK